MAQAQSGWDSDTHPLWWGLFLEEPLDTLLEKPVEHQHITFGYKTIPSEDVHWGAEYDVLVVGRGNDMINEGLLVEIPESLIYQYGGATIPHITLSTSMKGKPVNTKDLTFEPIEPFYIRCRMGFVMKDGQVRF